MPDDKDTKTKAVKFPFYTKLSAEEKTILETHLQEHTFLRGQEVVRGECTGLIYVDRGRLRAYSLSEEGREVTLYRLEGGEVCLLSASCMLSGFDYPVFVRAETDTRVVLIPAETYKRLSEHSLAVSAFTNELMGKRFSQVLWCMDTILNKKFDARLAQLLLQESEYARSSVLQLTHEQLAAHLGTVREGVSRMLKYFEKEGFVRLSRGGIELIDKEALQEIADSGKKE